MVFHRSTPNENFFYRFLSAEKRWELGFTQMIFGVRVRFGRVGEMTVVLDYCAGASRLHQLELLRLVMTILLPLPETVAIRDLEAVFPRCVVKPIFNDACWETLHRRAEEALATLSSGSDASRDASAPGSPPPSASEAEPSGAGAGADRPPREAGSPSSS